MYVSSGFLMDVDKTAGEAELTVNSVSGNRIMELVRSLTWRPKYITSAATRVYAVLLQTARHGRRDDH